MKKRNWFIKTFDPRMWFYDVGKWTAALFLWLWMRTKRIFENGKEPKDIFKGNYIIASNHVSLTDHFAIGTAIPFRRICNVGNADLFKGPFGWFFKITGSIPADKNHVSTKSIRKVQDTISRGHIVCMFPEGMIGDDQEIKTFKGGVAMMAAISQADILPIYLVRKKKWQRRIVIIGNKLKHEDLFKSSMPTKEELQRVSELLMAKEKELEDIFAID